MFSAQGFQLHMVHARKGWNDLETYQASGGFSFQLFFWEISWNFLIKKLRIRVKLHPEGLLNSNNHWYRFCCFLESPGQGHL